MTSFRCTYKAFILLIFIASQIIFARAQQITSANRTHVRKCESYKRQVYEKVYTYTAFIAGVPDFETRVDNCKKTTPLIVGGTPAKPKEFPHMARLGFAQRDQETKWFCGGPLISDKFVLTAAHCFYAPSRRVNIVRLGELIFNSETEDAHPDYFEVARYIPHPNYRMFAAYNDIGLVELKRLVIFSEYIVPACLPTRDDNFSQFIAVGWGATGFFEESSDLLSKVMLERIDNQICEDYVDVAQSNMLPRGLRAREHICAGSKKKKDTCLGDSGGPLLQIHDKYSCMYSVYGITSTGFGCGIFDTPGIYTRVFNYVDWIERHVFEY